eukprot:scaffold201191_cov15-Tisochrysis_lutea.AAC.1
MLCNSKIALCASLQHHATEYRSLTARSAEVQNSGARERDAQVATHPWFKGCQATIKKRAGEKGPAYFQWGGEGWPTKQLRQSMHTFISGGDTVTFTDCWPEATLPLIEKKNVPSCWGAAVMESFLPRVFS